MRVVVAGGTGFIGRPLCQSLVERGHIVTVLTRRPSDAARLKPSLSVTAWQGGDELAAMDEQRQPGWTAALEGSDAIINLAGEAIAGGRWTANMKARLRSSRVGSTRVLVKACSRLSSPPRQFLSASAIGYYGPRGDEILSEASPSGTGFLAELCRDWEAAALQAEGLGIRVTITRLGVVLGENGGALAMMLPVFRLGLGGPLGSGRQWMSWIHRDDVVSLLVQFLEKRQEMIVEGPVNLTAPNPVTNREFSRILGHIVRRPAFLPMPGFILRLLLGQMAEELLLTGQRVLPERAQRLGLHFHFPELQAALAAICGRHR